MSGTLEILFLALDFCFRQLVDNIQYAYAKQSGVMHVVLGIRCVFEKFCQPKTLVVASHKIHNLKK